jgi:hypothetical protein
METPPVINLIISDLTMDILKGQENLTFAINEKIDADEKLIKVKKYLTELILAEQMITKLNAIIGTQNQ